MKRVVGFLAFLAALSLAVPSFADEAAARAHFKKGIDLYDKKQFQEALKEFEGAYKEKSSAGIKQNIALCLKGLNRPADAATAFDEALDEGKDTLKPETKQAIERELADLTKIVATLMVTVADAQKSADTVITIQPVEGPARALAPGAHRKPIRLMPGIYTFSAKIPGSPPPEPKRLALVTGAPTDITFGGPGSSATSGPSELKVHANVPEAVIKVDGVEVGKGTWQGPVTANKKVRVEVTATGYREYRADVTVPANSTVDSPITLQRIGDAPGEYNSNTPAGMPVKPRGRFYAAFSLALEGSAYRLSPAVGGTDPDKSDGYPGVSAAVRFGYLALRNIAVEGILEAGVAAKDDKSVSAGTSGASSTSFKTQFTHWMLMPALRYQTTGKARFTAAMGAGVQGLQIENKPQGATPLTNTLKASGIGFAWQAEAGGQFDVGPVFLEGAAFVNIHGVGPVEEKVTGRRALLASPGVRGGLRFGVGIPF